MNPDTRRILYGLGVFGEAGVRRPYGDVIALYTEELKTLLNVNSNRGATSPDPHDEGWCKTTLKYSDAHTKRVIQEGFFLDKHFFDHLIQGLTSY
jgi:hypothetical protein